jgi:hypothetical protein
MPHLLKLIPTIKVFVADGEADTYLAAGVPKDQLLTHPNLVGFGKIRGYMDERTPNEVIVHIDDDLQAINVWSGSGYNLIRDHETIDRVVCVTIQPAMDLGVSIFGWGRRGTPAYFTQNEPFSLKEPASAACMGQIGRQFKFDPNLVGFLEDADMTLQALLNERIIFIDTRYYWHFGKSWGEQGRSPGSQKLPGENAGCRIHQAEVEQVHRMPEEITRRNDVLPDYGQAARKLLR